MIKLNYFKNIAKDILDVNKAVYEKDVLQNYQYSDECSISTIRNEMKKLKPEKININSIANILNKNFKIN